jgi:hypothetical protein
MQEAADFQASSGLDEDGAEQAQSVALHLRTVRQKLGHGIRFHGRTEQNERRISNGLRIILMARIIVDEMMVSGSRLRTEERFVWQRSTGL